MEGEAEYAFWHALVRDVAYGALPRAARVAKHRAAAAWIAARSGGVNGRTAEIVAEHYVRALELAAALGAGADELDAIRDPLVDALIGAADHAMGTSPSQAAMHARRALDLVGPDDPRRVEVLTTHGLAHLDGGHYPEARQSLEDARSLLLSKGGAPAAASLAVPLSSALLETGDALRATAILDEARGALADQPGATLLEVMAEQAMMFVRAGRPRAAEALGRQIVDLSEALGILPPPRALLAIGGDANYVRAIEIADATGNLRLSSKCRYNFAVHFRGRATAWLDVINDAIDFDRTHGITNLSTYNSRAFTSFNYLGRSAGVIEELETLIAKARETGDVFTECQAGTVLVEIRAARGEPVGPLDKLTADWEPWGSGTGPGPGAGMELDAGRGGIRQGRPEATRSLLTAFLDAGFEVEVPWMFVDRCLVAGDRALAERAAAAYRADAATHHNASPDAITLERPPTMPCPVGWPSRTETWRSLVTATSVRGAPSPSTGGTRPRAWSEAGSVAAWSTTVRSPPPSSTSKPADSSRRLSAWPP